MISNKLSRAIKLIVNVDFHMDRTAKQEGTTPEILWVLEGIWLQNSPSAQDVCFFVTFGFLLFYFCSLTKRENHHRRTTHFHGECATKSCQSCRKWADVRPKNSSNFDLVCKCVRNVFRKVRKLRKAHLEGAAKRWETSASAALGWANGGKAQSGRRTTNEQPPTTEKQPPTDRRRQANQASSADRAGSRCAICDFIVHVVEAKWFLKAKGKPLGAHRSATYKATAAVKHSGPNIWKTTFSWKDYKNLPKYMVQMD